MFFTKIKGHEEVLSRFKEWILKDSFSGVYLLCGPKGIGKYTIAKLLSKYILCNGLKDDSCRCNLCKQFQDAPDFLEIGINEDEEIKVADIDRVEDFVSLMPFKSKYRVVLIDNIENLNFQASNKLLKILEDLKPHTLFFLIASFPEKLISTVYSRTCSINFKALQPEDILEILKEQGLDSNKVETIKGAIPYFSQSVLKNAIKYYEYTKSIPELLITLSTRTEDEVLTYLNAVNEKDEFLYFLETILIYVNDILKIKYDGHNSIIFKENYEVLMKISFNWTEDICIALIEKLRKIILDNNKNLHLKLYPRVKAALSWIYLLLKTDAEKRDKDGKQ